MCELVHDREGGFSRTDRHESQIDALPMSVERMLFYCGDS